MRFFFLAGTSAAISLFKPPKIELLIVVPITREQVAPPRRRTRYDRSERRIPDGRQKRAGCRGAYVR
jgi:hypothetical protein